MRLATIAMGVMLGVAGCTHNPYPVHYQKAIDGLKPTERPKSFLAQRCTPEALEARTKELLAEGYVVIGRSEFVSTYPYHKEIHRQNDSQRAEIILFCDTADPTAVESNASPDSATHGRTGMTRHVAVYFARARSVNPPSK